MRRGRLTGPGRPCGDLGCSGRLGARRCRRARGCCGRTGRRGAGRPCRNCRRCRRGGCRRRDRRLRPGHTGIGRRSGAGPWGPLPLRTWLDRLHRACRRGDRRRTGSRGRGPASGGGIGRRRLGRHGTVGCPAGRLARGGLLRRRRRLRRVGGPPGRKGFVQLADDRRLDGGRGGTDELPQLLELGHDDLALDAELLREFVDPDLGHFSPSQSGPRRARTASSCAYSSLRAHRALIAIDPLLTIMDIVFVRYRGGAPPLGSRSST
jgi:hypothetical protein